MAATHPETSAPPKAEAGFKVSFSETSKPGSPDNGEAKGEKESRLSKRISRTSIFEGQKQRGSLAASGSQLLEMAMSIGGDTCESLLFNLFDIRQEAGNLNRFLNTDCEDASLSENEKKMFLLLAACFS